jgi:hypothetical protein
MKKLLKVKKRVFLPEIAQQVGMDYNRVWYAMGTRNELDNSNDGASEWYWASAQASLTNTNVLWTWYSGTTYSFHVSTFNGSTWTTLTPPSYPTNGINHIEMLPIRLHRGKATPPIEPATPH